MNDNVKENDLADVWGFASDEPAINTDDKTSDTNEAAADADANSANADAADNSADDDDDVNAAADAADDDDDDAADDGKSSDRQKTVPYKRLAKVTAQKKALEQKINELEAKLNGVIGVSEVLRSKEKAPELTLDDQLKAAELNPNDYYDDDDKKKALEQAILKQKVDELKEKVVSHETQMLLNNTAMEIERGFKLIEMRNKELAENADKAMQKLVDNQAFFVWQKNPNLSRSEAAAEAYNMVLAEVANRSLKSGKHPAFIAAELGAGLVEWLGIDLSAEKSLQPVKKESNINHKNREQSQQRAGRPAIDTATLGSVKIDDDTAALFAMF